MRILNPIRDLTRRRPTFPLPILHVAWEAALVRRHRQRLTAEGLGVPLRVSAVRRRKSSDTLFVLGSGTSINRLSSGQWEEIARCDSIGLNFWLVHEFVPTYYVFELPAEDDRLHVLGRLLELRAAAYTDTPLILKSAWRDDDRELGRTIPASLRGRILIDSGVTIPPAANADPRALDRSLAQLRWLGLAGLSFMRTSSLTFIAFLGVRLGYSRIVFCGADLHHSTYFFEERRAHYDALGVPMPRNAQDARFHRTLAPPPSYTAPGIVDVLASVRRLVCAPRGVELMVADSESALNESLPCFEWGSAGERIEASRGRPAS